MVFLICAVPSIVFVQGQGGMYGDCDEGTWIPGCSGGEADCDGGGNRCYSCNNGLVLVNDKNGQQECKECDTGVDKCIMCSENTKSCTLCKDGYRLVTNKKGVQKCKKCRDSVGENCFMCTKNLKKCEKCVGGYFKLGSDGKCYRTDVLNEDATDSVKHCVESIGSLCSGCDAGYVLVTEENGLEQKCKKCKTGQKNCIQCSADRKTCTWCRDGYTIRNGSCRKSTS